MLYDMTWAKFNSSNVEIASLLASLAKVETGNLASSHNKDTIYLVFRQVLDIALKN